MAEKKILTNKEKAELKKELEASGDPLAFIHDPRGDLLFKPTVEEEQEENEITQMRIKRREAEEKFAREHPDQVILNKIKRNDYLREVLDRMYDNIEKMQSEFSEKKYPKKIIDRCWKIIEDIKSLREDLEHYY
jgi:predicted ABC-class ATPase